MKEKRGPPFRNLPLFWKVLVPFLTLMVLVGAFGAFLIVRDLDSRAETALDQDLSRRSLDARSFLRDRELYLLESANFAANLEGIAERIRKNDSAAVGRFLQSVLALKTDLNLVAATDRSGMGIVEFTQTEPGAQPAFGRGKNWFEYQFVKQAREDQTGNKSSGFVAVADETMFGISAPVCSAVEQCSPVGVAIVAIGVDQLAAAARGKPTSGDSSVSRYETGISIYDAEGRLLTTEGIGATEETLPAGAGKRVHRRSHKVGSVEVFTLYSPFEVQGRPVGTLAVSIPTEPALQTVRGTGVRLAVIVFLAMAGVVLLGAIVSRLVLAQVQPLVEANRALGRGDLSARVAVIGEDELGELARGVNQMAEQLQASYETLEMRVAERTEEVQRLLKERTEFFASLSHELRTPLAVVLSEAKMMRDSSYPKRNGWADQSGKIIEGSAQQLLSLVNDILDLARAEAGSIEVQTEAIELQKFAKEMRPTIEGLARGNRLTVTLDVPGALPKVEADRNRLREIVLNLIDNAVKYTPEGGKLELSATANERFVEVSISDSGVGIPEEVGDLIFEPFYRVKGTRPQRGEASTGLGLALARRLVEAQGGTIWFVSRPEGGTEFTFSLPLASKRPKRINPRRPGHQALATIK